MKKYFMIFAAALLSFAACQEEMSPETTPNEDEIFDYPIEMTFTAGNEDATKTVISGTSITWESDDQIKVLWSETGYNKAIAEPFGENTCAKFTTTVEAAEAYYAVHPYAAESSYSEGNIVVTIPSEQGGAFENANIAVAKATENYAFPFRHLVGIVEFSTDTPGKVTISGAEDDVLTGTVTVTGFDENGYPVYNEDKVTDASSTIEIEVSQAGTYYAAFLPSATLKCLSVKVEGSEATEYALSPNQLQMARGKVWELGNIDGKFGKNLFVTATADGNGDGKTWETALTYAQVAEMLSVYRDGALSATIPVDAEEYKTTHKTVHAAQVNERVFHFAAGEYRSDNYVRISFPDNEEGVKFSFRGGYDATGSKGTDLSKRNIAEHVTTIKGAEGLSGGSGTQRVFVINKNINMTVDGITFTGGIIDGEGQVGGGVILADNCESSTMNFRNCKFTGNTSIYPGAAIKITSGKLNIEDCEFSNNTITTEEDGAAIHATGANTTVSVVGGKFTDNTSAGHGGAVYSTCAEFNATGVTFNNNSAGAKTGGAICCRDTETAAQLIIDNCTFTSNTSNAGGAVYANRGVWTFTNCNINTNSSTGVGGAFYLTGTAEMSVTGGSFGTNTARSDGGAIYVASKSFVVDDVDFIGNKGAQTAAGNSQGGAIYFANNESGSERTVSNCLFKENTVDAANAVYSSEEGGTKNYVRGGAVYIQASSPNVVFTTCTFESNQQLNATASYKKYGGGAIYSTKSFTATGCTFTKNDAYNYGAIGIENGPVSINGTFTSNTAVNGGAVGATGGSISFTECVFSKNSSSYGGVGYVKNSGVSLTFTDCDIDGNTSENNGGAFHFNPIKKATFTDCDITNNTVTGANMGGAFYLSGGSSVDIMRGTITGNSTGKSGGAFYSSGAETVVIDGTTISGNQAKAGDGGAIRFASAGNWTIKNATVSDNCTSSNGGAVYANTGKLTIENSTFSGNIANSGNNVGGGAVYVTANATLSVSGSTFTSNKANGSYQNSSDKTVYRKGGAIAISNSALVTHEINSTSFISNESGWGGGIYAGGGTVKLNNSIFESNSSPQGAAVRGDDKGTLYMNGCSFTANVPGNMNTGGTVYVSVASFINNCSFYGYDGSNANTSLVISGGTSTVVNTTILENSANATGVRLYGTGTVANLYNNVILAGAGSVVSGWHEIVGNITSAGYNYTSAWSTGPTKDDSVHSVTMADTDVTTGNISEFTLASTTDGRGYYTWTKPAEVTGTTTANVTAFLNGITGGSDFATWLGTVGGLTHDIAGNARPAEGWYPGCYQGE